MPKCKYGAGAGEHGAIQRAQCRDAYDGCCRDGAQRPEHGFHRLSDELFLSQSVEPDARNERHVDQEVKRRDDTCADEEHAQHVAPGVANLAGEICSLVPAPVAKKNENQGQPCRTARGRSNGRRRRLFRSHEPRQRHDHDENDGEKRERHLDPAAHVRAGKLQARQHDHRQCCMQCRCQ